mmetsp:Transcript_24280/g.56133  ORF Transcript_24280/g.56133 Transcript_24280/m.56133 type:complete len:200 (+) Transcript_24280:772-1371(+)
MCAHAQLLPEHVAGLSDRELLEEEVTTADRDVTHAAHLARVLARGVLARRGRRVVVGRTPKVDRAEAGDRTDDQCVVDGLAACDRDERVQALGLACAQAAARAQLSDHVAQRASALGAHAGVHRRRAAAPAARAGLVARRVGGHGHGLELGGQPEHLVAVEAPEQHRAARLVLARLVHRRRAVAAARALVLRHRREERG